MSSDTSLQTGTTPNPIPSNTQDFSGSDDEIMDNFAEGPDDGTPLGLGGEKEKQAEPASSTLEADIVNGTQPGESIPPEDSAGDSEPVPDASETASETEPEPETPEDEVSLPPMLLQMAGYADAESAKAAGLGTPEALAAYVRGRGELLSSARKAEESLDQPLYGLRGQQPQRDVAPTPQAADATPPAESTPFQFPADKLEMLDEDLQEILRGMHEEYSRRDAVRQKEVETLRTSLSERESASEIEQARNDAIQFDQDVQALGEEWQDIFGEGDGRELMRSGRTNPSARLASEYRGELYQHVHDIRADNAEKGMTPLSRQQELLYALMRQFPDKFQQAISKNSNGTGKRRGVTASRPTQRNTPPKSQNEKVLASVDAMLRKKHGHGLDMGHEDEFDGEI
jgi:hypothetical protein